MDYERKDRYLFFFFEHTTAPAQPVRSRKFSQPPTTISNCRIRLQKLGQVCLSPSLQQAIEPLYPIVSLLPQLHVLYVPQPGCFSLLYFSISTPAETKVVAITFAKTAFALRSKIVHSQPCMLPNLLPSLLHRVILFQIVDPPLQPKLDANKYDPL